MYTLFLFTHFIALALGVGSGFAMIRMGIATRNLPPAEQGALFQKLSALRFNGMTGLGLLILSGLGMLWQRPGLFTSAGGLFHAKLTLVGLMVIVVGVSHMIMGKAKRVGGPPPAILPKLGNVNLALAVVVILLAVMVFH
jgi:hypothetical protein